MIPPIPDKFHKLIILVGVFFIAFSYYIIKDDNISLSQEIDKYNDMVYEKDLLEFQNKIEEEKLLEYSSTMSKKFGIEELVYFNKDSSLVFNHILKGNKNKLIASDSIKKKWDIYNENDIKILILEKKLQNYLKKIDAKEKYNDSLNWKSIEYLIIGSIMFLIGMFYWTVTEDNEKRFIKLQDKIHLACQSCGKLFSSSRKYGTEKDGSLSNCYCKQCYKKGKFTNKDLTKEEFLRVAKEEIKNENFIIRYILMKRLEKLERWNPDKYTFN